MSSDKLSKSQHDAIKTEEGTKVLIVTMNKEINVLKKTVVKTQNELESWRSKYHDVDKDNGILNTKLELFVGIEIFKYLLSAVGTAYGINLVTSGMNTGWLYVGGSALLYIVITLWQKKTS